MLYEEQQYRFFTDRIKEVEKLMKKPENRDSRKYAKLKQELIRFRTIRKNWRIKWNKRIQLNLFN